MRVKSIRKLPQREVLIGGVLVVCSLAAYKLATEDGAPYMLLPGMLVGVMVAPWWRLMEMHMVRRKASFGRLPCSSTCSAMVRLKDLIKEIADSSRRIQIPMPPIQPRGAR